MTTPETLEELLKANAFAPTKSFERLVSFHVEFDQLTHSNEVELPLSRALGRGHRSAVVGPPGAGKSSVLAYLLQPPVELGTTFRPISLSIGGEADREQLLDVRRLGRRLIGDIAFNYLSAEDAEALREAGAIELSRTSPSSTTKAEAGPRFLRVSREIRQAAQSYDVERSAAEMLAVITDAVKPLQADATVSSS